MFSKIVENGIILCAVKGPCYSGIEITREEYDTILDLIRNAPQSTETTDYRLREDLTWEEYELDPPDPDPEIDDAEIYEILFGGAE